MLALALVVPLALPLVAAERPASPALSRSDEAALLTAACAWVDGSRAVVAQKKCAAPSELEWSSARPGRFVGGDGEWLVSLAAPCIGGCSGVTFVARKTAGKWTQLYQEEALVTDSCVTVRGLADGWDRVACQAAAGPHMGAMTEWVDVRRYAKEASSANVLYKEHGGECFLPEPPEKAEYDGDGLAGLTAGEAGSDTAFTVRLTVRRAECDRTDEDPERSATVRGEHVLRFVKRGNAIVPDEATRALADRYGWAPGQ